VWVKSSGTKRVLPCGVDGSIAFGGAWLEVLKKLRNFEAYP